MTNEIRGSGIVTTPPSQYGEVGEEHQVAIRPKLYLNGFPKSGLHLAVTMARCIVREKAFDYPWAGTFAYNAWSTQWLPNTKIMPTLARLQEDTWLKGHCGYKGDIEQMLFHMGVSKVFIYRDLRDVLVSQSYHVLEDDDKKFYHPNKEIYRRLKEDGGQEAVLMACLEGVGPYAGIFDRWQQYMPWLSVAWVHKMRFEDMVHNMDQTAWDFTWYVYSRMGLSHGIDIAIPEKVMEEAVQGIKKATARKDASPTFRKGTTGQWREEFTPKVKEAFKARAGNWLIRLGYEEDNEW